VNIFQRLWARIRGIHNVDAALGGVAQAVDKLQAAAEHHDNLAELHQAAELEAEASKNAALTERDRALRVVDKLRALVA
jgi:hypothetical protein